MSSKAIGFSPCVTIALHVGLSHLRGSRSGVVQLDLLGGPIAAARFQIEADVVDRKVVAPLLVLIHDRLRLEGLVDQESFALLSPSPEGAEVVHSIPISIEAETGLGLPGARLAVQRVASILQREGIRFIAELIVPDMEMRLPPTPSRLSVGRLIAQARAVAESVRHG